MANQAFGEARGVAAPWQLGRLGSDAVAAPGPLSSVAHRAMPREQSASSMGVSMKG